MSDYKKMKMLAIYEALKDVIEDKLFWTDYKIMEDVLK
jgi:hypothetical protein